MEKIFLKFQSLMKPIRPLDVMILCVFTVLILINPYFLNDRINVFELGLYLPGINGILHGDVPYRDFFHLRGPLELYVPAWLMNIFGTHIQVLSAYFYFGNVLCLIMVVLIAAELIRTRLVLYMMIPVIIARTYPRVVYMIWGGMRYAMGLVAMYFLIKFIRTKRIGWVIGAGIAAGLAALISIEIGVYAGLAVCGALGGAWFMNKTDRPVFARGLLTFLGSSVLAVSPWILYSWSQQALIPYFEDMWTIVTRMQVVIDPHLVSIYPRNLPEALAAMFNPGSVNFKHMTPSFLYVVLLGYLVRCLWIRKWGVEQSILLGLGIYGFIMYNTGFRGIWASQFEMALMPQKVIYFLFIEMVILSVWARRPRMAPWQRIITGIVVAGLFLGSIGYALARYNKRFWAFQYVMETVKGKDTAYLKFKDKNQQYAQLNIDRADGLWVPVDQYEDLKQLSAWIKTSTTPQQAVMMYPEMATFNFLFDRPFSGRFPVTTFAWFNDQWFESYFQELNQEGPAVIVRQKNLPPDWYTVYLGYLPNKIKYEQLDDFIRSNYRMVFQTNSFDVLRKK